MLISAVYLLNFLHANTSSTRHGDDCLLPWKRRDWRLGCEISWYLVKFGIFLCRYVARIVCRASHMRLDISESGILSGTCTVLRRQPTEVSCIPPVLILLSRMPVAKCNLCVYGCHDSSPIHATSSGINHKMLTV